MLKPMIKKIEIDQDCCTGCKSCVDACFVDVYHWNEADRKPVVAYPEDCVWCSQCEDACPNQCIEVVPIIPSPMKESGGKGDV